ncbi:transmembrane protein 220 [Ciona intestinalis]
MEGKETTSVFFQISHFLAAIYFALSAYVQTNDPDPEIWIPIYLLPATIALCTAAKPSFTEFSVVSKVNDLIVMGCCIYGGFILDSSYKFEENIFHWVVHDEAGREFGGLLVICLWTICMHGSSTTRTKRSLVFLCIIVLSPALLWVYIYMNKSFRSLWPKHCQTALYPDLVSKSEF